MEEKSANSTSETSGTGRATIGSTTISTKQAEIVKKEVRDTIAKTFPRIHMLSGSTVQPNPSQGTVNTGSGNVEAEVVDLDTRSAPTSAPIAIAGSDVSIASTSTNPGNGGNATSFSRMSLGTGAASHPQMWTTTQWKPKEPPCFYGRSSEYVHTWTSLVRHYLTFMGGSDAQQVAYAVTLLREHAHEWFMGYEKRHRNLPRDWSQLASALLERFGSNI